MKQVRNLGRALTVLVIILFLTLPTLLGAAVQISAGQGQAATQYEQARMHILSITNDSPSSAIKEFPIPQSGSDPLGIVTDSNGNVWFAQSNTDELVEYSPTNSSFQSFRIPTSTHPLLVWFMFFDSRGYLWFSDESQPLLWRFSPATHSFANYSTGAPNADPFSLAYQASTNQIWFTSPFTDQLGAFQIESNESASLSRMIFVPSPTITNPTSASAPKVLPTGLSLNSQGEVFLSESSPSSGAIAEYSPSLSRFIHIWPLSKGSEPVGLSVDENLGRIWFTNHATSFVGYLNESTGSVEELSTSLFNYTIASLGISESITLPYWIQVSPDGSVWFDEHYGNKIARLDPQNMQLTEFAAPTNDSQPLRFVLDNQSGLVWFTEFSGNNIGVLNQNESTDSQVSLSKDLIVLSSLSASFDVKLVLPSGGETYPPLVSGSLYFNGYLDSNLTISSQRINSSSFKVIVNRGESLSSGDFTLTVCPTTSISDSPYSPSPVRHCAVVQLIVQNNGLSGLGQIEVYSLALAIIAAIAIISLLYVRRWRSLSGGSSV